jgi:hypothetical protein
VTAPDLWLRRLERDAILVAAAMAAAALAAWPGRPERAAGVLGGFALIAVSYQGIRAGVANLWPAADGRSAADSGAPASESGAGDGAPTASPRASAGFVKFFTRHAILAFGAYVMMARFDFDPMAMLVGVTSPAVAATVEIVRTIRARRSGRRPGRSS